MKDRIPIFQYKVEETFRRRFHEGVDRILDQAYLSNHQVGEEFELAFSKWNESRFSLSLSNGTAALQALLEGVGVVGKEVILPSNTFIATAKAVIAAGGIPVIADIESEFVSLDLETVHSSLTEKTGALLPVHIGGLVSPEIKRFWDLCQDRGLYLIEDCAQAHGASRSGIRVGNFGHGGAFSFFLTKIMTMGEGGAVVTNDKDLYGRMKSLRQFGMDMEKPLEFRSGGGNFKLPEFSALLGLLELERVDARITRRVHLAKIYQTRLAGSAWKTLQADADSFCPHYKQIVISPVERSRVEAHLQKKNISLTGGVYFEPLHRQPALQEFIKRGQSFPVSDRFADSHICPPCYPELSDDDVHRVCDALLSLGGAGG